MGETISVNWEGPDESGDMIAVAKVGRPNLIYKARTRKGSPLNLQMPDEPGEYEIRYVLDQGKTTLVARPVSVVDATAD